MPRRTERRLLGLLAAVGALLVAVTGIALAALFRADEDIHRVGRAHELIARLSSAHLAAADVESGLCAHLLTGDRALLEPASGARVAIRRHLARATELAADDAVTRARIARLATLVEARLRAVDDVLSERAAGPLSPERTNAAVAESARQKDAIHDAVGEIVGDAEKHIAVRAESLQTAARARVALFAGIVGAALLMLGGGFFLVRRELRRRLAAEAGHTAARQAAERAGQELEAFSYSLAHDLRAPLRAIDGFAQALAEDAEERLEPAEKELLRRIRAAAQRMGVLIDDLLELARITRTRFSPEAVDLSELAKAVVDDLRTGDPAREVEVVVAPGLEARGDRRLLRVALENLLGNAWKYTSKKPHARIEFARVDGQPSTYVVRDDGAGFDPRYADRLFGPFQRLHGEAEFPGTGIGLATVQRIVHRHGGTVRAEGRPDEGAAFYFTLPAALDGAASPNAN